MVFSANELLWCFSRGLDAVESDFLGASTNHGYRIATLCAAMGRHLGMEDTELSTLAACALLHDNALTEYILSERPGSAREFNMRSHCVHGQQNIAALPLRSGYAGLVLYHHERADGKGPFGKQEGEFPPGAALIAIADMLDAGKHLQRLAPADLPELRAVILRGRGRRFTTTAADALLAVLDEAMLESLRDERVQATVAAAMPRWMVDLDHDAIVRVAGFAGRIIDYKSEFTKKHSEQIANIAWHMARYYGYTEEMQAQIFLAASLHDIGKLYIPTGILEKPGKLTDEEYASIQEHIVWTRRLLSGITGFEDICEWASNHHEKLDGSGYPRHLCADRLDFISRMFACIDIYQAVGASRPYHPARSHQETMAILHDLANRGQLDAGIVSDLDRELARYPNESVPPPAPIPV